MEKTNILSEIFNSSCHSGRRKAKPTRSAFSDDQSFIIALLEYYDGSANLSTLHKSLRNNINAYRRELIALESAGVITAARQPRANGAGRPMVIINLMKS